jgi:uncharacterized protein (DUF111 family)
MTTVDDIPPEGLPYIIKRTLEEGANNIHILNAITKKGRMEYIILVDLDEHKLDEICSLLALEFGTLGIKTLQINHLKLPYEIYTKNVTIKTTDLKVKSKVRIKYLKKGINEIISVKADYKDLKSLAQMLNSKGIKIPFSKLKTIIEAETYKNVLSKKNIIIKIK